MDLLVNYGIRASSLAPSFGTYELLYEETVAHNKTQIDITGLNIGKDDTLRLVYTFVAADTTTRNYSIRVNDITSNYTRQALAGSGSSIVAVRSSDSVIAIARSNIRAQGFVDIKVSNNDRFVCQSQYVLELGGDPAPAAYNENYNIVNTGTVTSITKLSIVANVANQIAVGSKIALYKVTEAA